MGVHCYLTELGTLAAMAAKIAAVITLASLCAAEPGYGYGYGINAVAYHPYGGYSSEYRSTQGLTGYGGYYGKREAEPGYGYGGHSHVYRTTEGLTEGYYGKRSAEPGYGYSSGVSYYHRSPQGVQGYGYGGYHKRSAEPGYGYSSGHGHSYVHQDRDHYHGSYGCEIDHDYKKRSAEAKPGYGYGGHSYVYRTTEGLTGGYYGKRSAEPGYGYSSGISYYHRSPQGVQGYGYGGYHKRSAEPGY